MLDCPTPEKMWYATERAARHRAVLRTQTLGHEIEPYQCRCGSWHLTSTKQREVSEARRAEVEQIRYWLAELDRRGWTPIRRVDPNSFTPEEDALVRDPRYTKAQVAEITGRSLKAVNNRRDRLNRRLKDPLTAAAEQRARDAILQKT